MTAHPTCTREGPLDHALVCSHCCWCGLLGLEAVPLCEGPGRGTTPSPHSSQDFVALWCLPSSLSPPGWGLQPSPSFSICNQLHNFGHLALCWTSFCSVGFGGSKPFLLWVEGLPCIPPGLGAPSLLWGLVTYLIPGSGASGSAASSSLITPASAVILLPLCQSETRKLL